MHISRTALLSLSLSALAAACLVASASGFWPAVTASAEGAEDPQRGLRAVAPDAKPAERHGFYRDSWAVVIGINDYQKWPRLANAVNDAKGMEQALVDILKFPRDHIFTLYDADATKDHIRWIIEDKLMDPAKVQKDDRVIVFYAGHGGNRELPDGRFRGYLVPVDADLEHLESTAIPMKDLTDWAEAITAKHLFYVLDACYSGLAMTRGGPPLGGGTRAYIDRVVSRDARKILTAGGKDEQVADGGPRGHSVFTGNLLIGLEGPGDTDGDGVVTASELGQYVLRNVSAVARQTPACGNLPGDQGGEVILNVLDDVSPAYAAATAATTAQAGTTPGPGTGPGNPVSVSPPASASSVTSFQPSSATGTAPAAYPSPSPGPAPPARQAAEIRVLTAPEKAAVSVAGAYRGDSPLTISELAPGTYEVGLRAAGCADTSRLITVGAGQTYVLDVPLRSVTGGLRITSSPAGAQVILNDVPRGSTTADGLRIDGLQTGAYGLVLRRDGYQDYRDDIVIDPAGTTRVTATLAALPGRLSIESTPSGASVMVDGADKGMTPLVVPGLAPGAHRVQLTRLGYDAVDEQAVVEFDRTLDRSYTLRQAIAASPAAPGTANWIEWTSQTIRATGLAAPNPKLPAATQRAATQTAAKVLALRNALEALKGVQVSSETTVENLMLQSDVVKTQLRAMANSFRVADTRYYPDGTVEVDVEMQIGEGFRELVTPPGPGLESRPPTGASAGDGGGRYTGMIIDSRGLKIQPSISPRILDEQGREIYGASLVDRDYAVKIGVAGYEKDLTRARTNERIGSRPLVIKGIKASGRNSTDVVVSDFDGKAIQELAQTLRFLSECRVMVVVD